MTALSDYKKVLIIARTNLYNTNLATLMTYYQGLMDSVNQNKTFSRNSKRIKINAIVRAKNGAIYALRLKYNADVANINRIKVVPAPPVVIRTVPKKTALLVGINYIGTPNRLNGCINDTVVMSNMLMNSYAYNSADITFMTDNTSIKPYGDNILNAFTDLLKNAISGDRLFFFYSGHGTQKADNTNLNPNDKIDECIYPLGGNIITDTKFKQLIDGNMKTGVSLVAIFDSCFSGTIMNLKYNYLNSDHNNMLFVDSYESVVAGNVICISGCKDEQTSEDAYINGDYNGALTWALSTSISSSSSLLSWTQLIDNTRMILLANTFPQLPQFSSSDQMDLSEFVSF
jgi:outer membrane protein OmpA-like peptidoglycan-associated protein